MRLPSFGLFEKLKGRHGWGDVCKRLASPKSVKSYIKWNKTKSLLLDCDSLAAQIARPFLTASGRSVAEWLGVGHGLD